MKSKKITKKELTQEELNKTMTPEQRKCEHDLDMDDVFLVLHGNYWKTHCKKCGLEARKYNE